MAAHSMPRCVTALILVALVVTVALPAHSVIAQDVLPGRHAGAAASPVFLPAVFRAQLPLPAAEVSAALDAIKGQFDALPGVDEIAERKLLVETLTGLPDLASSGMAEDGSVWAELSDGRLITIPMAKSRDEGTDRDALTVHFPNAPQDELPATQRAYVMNALGSCFTDTSQEIAAWLTSGGYQVMATPPTVEGLKSVRDAAVLFFDSHGGLARPITGTTYTMWTQTLWSLSNDVAYLSDLMAGRMAYMLATEDRNPNGVGCSTAWHYSITPAFVSTYMTFVPNSFVFFNGCSGMHPAAQPMRQAFAGAGASVFAGWTNPISDGLSAAVARQLILGAHD